MRIERMTDIREILRCLPFEQEIRNKGRDFGRISDLLLFVQSQLESPLFGFWIAYADDSDDIRGYAVGLINPIPGMQCLHILRIYAKDKDLFNRFYTVGKDWAKQWGVKKMQIAVPEKHAKAFQRLYGFDLMSINLERKL